MMVSRPSTAQSVTMARIASATDIARAQAIWRPEAIPAAAESAARSAADWARCRAITTDPSTATPAVTASSTMTMPSAARLADPVSSTARLGHRHGFGSDGDPRQQHRFRTDPGHQQLTLTVHRHLGTSRTDPLRGGHAVIPAGGQPGRLPGGVDTPDLQHRGIERGQTDQQNRYQRGNRERGLDGGGTGVIAQTLVFSARVMMLDSALTMESPVTTVYRIAPKAAAAIVPIAYSIPFDSYPRYDAGT